MTGYAVCTANVMLILKRDGFASSLKITLLFLLTQLTAEMYFSVRSALLFVQLHTLVRTKVGRQNICLSSAFRSQTAILSISALHSHQLAVRQTLLCLSHLKDTREKVTKYGAQVTIFLGLRKVLTDAFMLSTLKTVSSVQHLVLTKSLTLTLLLQQRRVQSLQMQLLTLITTLYGGKVLIRTHLQTQLTGRVTLGTVRQAKKRAHIQTQDLQLLLLTALAFHLNLKIQTVFLFQHSYSAAAVQSLLRLYISQRTGITVYSQVQLWVLKQLLLQQVKLVLFAVTLWQCSHSAATIWAIIGSTGLKSVNLLMKIKHLRFSMLTGSVKMMKVTSYGLVLVITSEFLIGLLTVAKARLTLRKQLSVIFHMLRILTLKALI